jgi:acetyl-CoA acetyltransferase
MRGEVVIAGIGRTAVGSLPGRDRVSLIVEAVAAALADAGIEKDRVDAVLVKIANSAPSPLYGQKVAEALGLQPTLGCALDQGGAANIALLTYASLAIQAGMIQTAIICYGDLARSGDSSVYSRPRGDDGQYGWFSTAAGYALIHRAYSGAYRLPDAAFGRIVTQFRSNGARNPAAQLQRPLTLDEYLASPFVVEPLRKDDCCLLSDGAAAIVVTSRSNARALGITRAVPILGIGQAQESYEVHLRDSLTSTMASKSAAMAFSMASIGPRRIGVAQLYDCFSVVPLITLEDYGFCGPGQAAAFCEDIGINPEGGLALNTSGGLLSETGMPGLQLILEGVRQVRREARLQASNAEFCLVSNQGGTMHTHGTLILGEPA